jgi:hypothetical protein
MHMAVERFEIIALVEVAACGAIGGLRPWQTRLSQPSRNTSLHQSIGGLIYTSRKGYDQAFGA